VIWIGLAAWLRPSEGGRGAARPAHQQGGFLPAALGAAQENGARITASIIGKGISLYAIKRGICFRGKLDIWKPDHALKPSLELR
jgi:hypothetical protein